jgi:hypothetical protein
MPSVARHVAMSFSAALVVLSTAGCARIFGGSTQRLTVTSDPPGAHVFVAGADSGVTPRVMRITREHAPLQLRVQGDGVASDTRTIGRQLSVAGLLFDALLVIPGGGLPCGVGVRQCVAGIGWALVLGFGTDFVTGAIWLLETDSVHVKLPPAAGARP